jgi:hypothetical protein
MIVVQGVCNAMGVVEEYEWVGGMQVDGSITKESGGYIKTKVSLWCDRMHAIRDAASLLLSWLVV